MGRIDDAARMQDVREALDPWERRERERLGKTGLQISPEVWEAQQQELVRLSEQIKTMAQVASSAMEMLEQDKQRLTARVAELEEALKEIVDPISFMRDRANAEGAALNGAMCVQMSESHSYLRGIAKRALVTQPESPHNTPSLPQEPPVPVSAGDSSSECYAGMPWEGRP